jgi:hypothetical protein
MLNLTWIKAPDENWTESVILVAELKKKDGTTFEIAKNSFIVFNRDLGGKTQITIAQVIGFKWSMGARGPRAVFYRPYRDVEKKWAPVITFGRQRELSFVELQTVRNLSQCLPNSDAVEE